ncbi:hypothetical protein PIB30_032808 [Stylosanthes scabra]|uniref:HSF-type DNA-binding domain-containing protein n=1 Tax=Stylosanthes scabra TaxID=79078 RepID=A0ABU6XE02_9FABA|nr:hypothetical protein [Stylosanthes scabra]
MGLLLDNCDSILMSLDSHKSVPAPFLTKTYQLVDDPATDHIVSWGEDQTTFVVWRPPEFARDLLPNYFKHNNFSSFVRQLNTYGFRKIVPDRWEFANEFFKKGEKHLLCEIHRRKTAHHPQQLTAINHHHSPLGINVPSFFPFSAGRLSISPSNDSDDQASNWCDSPPPTTRPCYNSSVTALSEDNERLRRSNSMLMSELAHMKKLYNDIIYFVQNHVKPVPPSSNSCSSSSLLLCNSMMNSNGSSGAANNGNVSMLQRPMNHLLGYYSSNPKQVTQANVVNSARSSVTIVEAAAPPCKTKLFGVSLQSKKRVHPEYGSETNKARLVLEKDDLGLNLMPPSTC